MPQGRVHMIAIGMVQGVGFRYFVQRRALRLGLTGFVRNLPDGNVEVEAEGDKSLLQELLNEVRTGPRLGHVSDVRIEWKPLKNEFVSFEIL
jgi:acylphosphatase